MRTSRGLLCGLTVAVLVLAGCGPTPSKSPENEDGTLEVVASIPPLASLVKRIGGERVHVRTLLSPGQGPHTFSPTPKQIMALGEASVYFHVGGFAFEEELAGRIEANFPNLAVCNASEGIEPHAEGGAHDAHGHDHAADPHVWMAPPQLLVMADNVAEALQTVDGTHAADYERNVNALKSDLADFHVQLTEMLRPYKGRTFYIYHPALGYFAEAYGLNQESVEVGGKKPTPRQLQELIEQAREDNVKVVFVQPQFDERSAESVAEAIGGSVVPLDPLREDILYNLREIGTKLADAFAAEPSP